MAKDSEQTGIIVAGVVALVIIANIRGLFQGIGRGLGIGSETSEEKDRAGAAEVAQAAQFYGQREANRPRTDDEYSRVFHCLVLCCCHCLRPGASRWARRF